MKQSALNQVHISKIKWSIMYKTMHKPIGQFITGLAIVVLLTVSACSPQNLLNNQVSTATANSPSVQSSINPRESARLLTAAATSLKDALEEITRLFNEEEPSLGVTFNFAASGPLQQQIEQGAPVDIFISSANQQMDNLQKNNLILVDTRKQLVTNTLVLIVPSNSTLGLSSFEQLTDSKVKKIAVGEPRSVPVGRYSEEVFTKLGILADVRSKLVYGNSVRNVLSAVASGNTDAGIVYLSDAKTSNQVRQVATAAADWHSPIVYPIAVTKISRIPQAAKIYVDFLSSRPAQDIFKKYGFGTMN
jgi:molybdate transport system substrate-binding protein